ncbi:Aly2p RNJ42_03272 [Nakaseomyces bracarensis]|uniref:Aly2p n=1 Tax=Nakaseomyces bracarensis TaxID=273131 RepID=UPI0038719ECA
MLHTENSPLFPVGKDVTIPSDAKPVANTSSVQIYIKLAEPVVFVQGFEDLAHSDKPPGILRGSLILRILKPTKVKNLTLHFKGYARTEWIEGIPPKKQEFAENNDIVNHTWPFYQAEHHNHHSNGHHGSHGGSRTPGSNSIASSSETSSLRQESPDSGDNAIFKGTGASIYRPLPRNVNGDKSQKSSHTPQSSISSATNLSPLKNNNILRSKSKDNLDEFARKRGLPRASSHSTLTNSSFAPDRNSSGKGISPISFLRRATSSTSAHTFGLTDSPTNGQRNGGATTPTHHGTTTSLISDILSGNFAGSYDSSHANGNTPPYNSSHSTLNTNNTPINQIVDNGTFQPGDYIYPFEQLIPQSYPESIKAEYGFVEYYLFVTLERYGPFKSNLTGRMPVHIIRTQSDNSVEESEPIIISRDWENALFYDIVIGSKEIVLDAFLPINFRLSPMEKLTLHRIRIYVTETMEYYCKKQKVHRIEPTKKFLLAEHKGPKLPGLPKDANYNKAKNMGNLLLDESSGDLVNKEFQYQLFVPSKFNNHQKIHPDTTYDNIKSNHWIKICLRLSRIVGDKRKHYEISIDSPIHVLHKLCSHANTLLPSYDSHLLMNHQNILNPNAPNNDHINDHDISRYHNSNIFFPKEIVMSPLMSPDVQPLDGNVESIYNGTPYRVSRHSDDTEAQAKGSSIDINKSVFNSPTLKSNIYQPDTIQRELASPQAIPLSPIVSAISLADLSAMGDKSPPPEFDSIEDQLSAATTRENSPLLLPKDPPSYDDVLQTDGVGVVSNTKIPKIQLSKSQESLPPAKASRIRGMAPYSENASFNSLDNDGDIAAGFNFSNSPNLVRPILKSNSPSMISLNTNDHNRVTLTPRHDNMHDYFPSTIRGNNHFYNDISQILGDGSDENGHLTLSKTHESSNGASARSSFDNTGIIFDKDGENAQPLLSTTNDSRVSGLGEHDLQSRESFSHILEQPTDSSVDITALYDRNSSSWHPLQLDSGVPLSPTISNGSHTNALLRSDSNLEDRVISDLSISPLKDIIQTDDSSGGNSLLEQGSGPTLDNEKPFLNESKRTKNMKNYSGHVN